METTTSILSLMALGNFRRAHRHAFFSLTPETRPALDLGLQNPFDPKARSRRGLMVRRMVIATLWATARRYLAPDFLNILQPREVRV